MRGRRRPPATPAVVSALWFYFVSKRSNIVSNNCSRTEALRAGTRFDLAETIRRSLFTESQRKKAEHPHRCHLH